MMRMMKVMNWVGLSSRVGLQPVVWSGSGRDGPETARSRVSQRTGLRRPRPATWHLRKE